MKMAAILIKTTETRPKHFHFGDRKAASAYKQNNERFGLAVLDISFFFTNASERRL